MKLGAEKLPILNFNFALSPIHAKILDLSIDAKNEDKIQIKFQKSYRRRFHLYHN